MALARAVLASHASIDPVPLGQEDREKGDREGRGRKRSNRASLTHPPREAIALEYGVGDETPKEGKSVGPTKESAAALKPQPAFGEADPKPVPRARPVGAN